MDLSLIQSNYNMAIYTSDHIGKWHWLKYDNNIILAEEFSSELSRAVSGKKLIQGDAGVHVMSVNGKTMTSSFSSDILIEIPNPKYNIDRSVPSVITPPFSQKYKDLFDLLISDFTYIKENLYIPDYRYLRSRNLLSSASIQIGNTVRCSLNYNAYYDQIFLEKITFADYFPDNLDFLARVAKNYDCRFYANLDEDQYLKILSGSINITVDHTKIYLANLFSEYPIYSPQGYEVSGSIVVPARDWNLLRNYFNSSTLRLKNFSLLIGNRYLRLGQTVIEDKISFSMGDNMMTAEISFKGFARL